MPLPRPLARFNHYVTNRLFGPLAPYLPGFGVVVHTGRKTHRHYRNPVNVFRRNGRYVIALTYGPNSDWVRNVLAAGGCTLITRGRAVRLTRPRLYHDEQRRALPAPASLIGALANFSDFLELDVDDLSSAAAQAGGRQRRAARRPVG
jgi:deazaflavin-dependent oxidoreductase (nitroreductase family)